MPIRWIWAVVLTLGLAPGAAAQDSGRRPTVVDYFHALGFFEDPARDNSRMLNEALGAVVDIPNGYLYAVGDGAQGPLWVCVFRRTDRSHLVAVMSRSPDTDAYTDLRFYRAAGDGYAEVTESVLPEPVRGGWKYDLPRYGTTIRVRDEHGRPHHDLAWTGERFVRRPPADLHQRSSAVGP